MYVSGYWGTPKIGDYKNPPDGFEQVSSGKAVVGGRYPGTVQKKANPRFLIL